MKKKIYLFGIPLLKIKTNISEMKMSLFGIIPILSMKASGVINTNNNSENQTIIDGHNNEWTEFNYKTCAKVGKKLYCGGKTILTKNTYLGDFVCFNGCEIAGGGKVTIGNNFHSGVDVLMLTQNHNYDKGTQIPYAPHDFICKPIEIGDFVWLGSRVTLLPGTKIGKGAIIQAGSVVHGEIPPYAIAGGNPAKVFMYRDKEHFDKLEKDKCFKH